MSHLSHLPHLPRQLSRTVLPLAAALLAGCTVVQTQDPLITAPYAPAPGAEMPAAMTPASATAAPRNAALAALFDQYDRDRLALSPQSKAQRGIRDGDYGKWNDQSAANQARQDALMDAAAARLRADFPLESLSPADRLSVRLFLANHARDLAGRPYAEHGYIFDQMNGAQASYAAFLINTHRVASEAEADAYVSRIAGIADSLDERRTRSAARAAAGVMPPAWVYPYVIDDIDNQVKGSGPNLAGQPVLDDFRAKLAKLTIAPERRAALEAAAVTAWRERAVPAYARLRGEMVRQQKMAGTDDGVWRLPDGAAYYDQLLRRYTTTSLTADQIHDIGLREVARIQNEMRAIMRQVGFTGTLQQFFVKMRDDPANYYPTREAYLADTDRAMKQMEARLPDYFLTLPKDPLLVKPVEAFREKSAGKAFYQSPAADGSRPGIYYVNLYDLKSMAKAELEALAYHEGIPGHHLQLSIQTGLGQVPPFRRFGGVTAYSEGWGLYTEELGKDMGFYRDPISDFGRLQMELWRAVRLVVDTGIHSKRWSRMRAIQYHRDNTPNPEGDIVKAVERYVVYPGQATAYMIGKLKIMELRERARTRLGNRFDIRRFHEVVLASGPVPLDIMEENVDAWIAAGGPDPRVA